MAGSHTYAVLKVSKTTYAEIRKKLVEADYSGQFDNDDDGEIIDMHGIALQSDES